ncbi:hypothetical protein ASNO1_49230 [Corallococcus caeni]|uniref:Uncharacterized protein n=2 Tax=Corallococcus caeni TaxID=3082388 RepID=A0ABQ6QXB9_9BACT|nr:hypothetical protein ASNO1_49230 [Corallococcus sp. NO1]
MMPPTPHASTFVSLGIAGLSLFMLGAWGILAWRSTRGQVDGLRITVRFTVALCVWASGWLGLALSGVLARLDLRPPPFALLPPGLVVAVALLLRTGAGRLLSRNTPLWLLVGLQAFRLPLELVMHQAALEGVMPAQMTFGAVRGVTGLNYDILTGASALLLALWLRTGDVPRQVVLAWNVFGSMLLLGILSIAVVSTPLVALFGDAPDRLNTWVLFAPFVWLPSVLVGSALFGHALLFRRLWRDRVPSGRAP